MKDILSLPRSLSRIRLNSWGGAMVATMAVPRKNGIKGSLVGHLRASLVIRPYTNTLGDYDLPQCSG